MGGLQAHQGLMLMLRKRQADPRLRFICIGKVGHQNRCGPTVFQGELIQPLNGILSLCRLKPQTIHAGVQLQENLGFVCRLPLRNSREVIQLVLIVNHPIATQLHGLQQIGLIKTALE